MADLNLKCPMCMETLSEEDFDFDRVDMVRDLHFELFHPGITFHKGFYYQDGVQMDWYDCETCAASFLTIHDHGD